MRCILMIAAWFGLIAGFSEGLTDLTIAHLHAPAILVVTLLADFAISLAIGLLLTLVYRVTHRVALLIFIFIWTLFICAGAENIALAAGGVAGGALGLLAERHWRWTERIVRRSLPWIAGAAAVCLLTIPLYGYRSERQALAALPATAPDTPNIVLVIMDTVRADHLSCYGYDRPTSPNIDRLGREGVLFETAVSTSSWTLPSHASMMTGTYPHVHHVQLADQELASGFLTLPWVLREAGYRTAAFSANWYLFSRSNGLGQGFIHFGDYFLSATDALAQVNFAWTFDQLLIRMKAAETYVGRQRAADINRAALQWVGSSRHPFFLALNYMDAHDPYVPPQPWRHRFSKRLDPGGHLDIGEGILPKLTPAQTRDEMDACDGAVAYEDAEIGRLLGELKARGLLSNTLVIITSDHGEAFGEHGLLDHANALYFPLIHVPLVFYWPGHIPAGVHIARPISTKDIGPTILALAGVPPDRLPGESLEALWTPHNDPSTWPLPISELAQMDDFVPQFPDYYGPLEAIVALEAQYIVDPRLGPLLYDWKADPREVHNLIHDPRYQTLATELGDDLRAEREPREFGHVAHAGLPANSQ